MGAVWARKVWQREGIFYYLLWLWALPLSLAYGLAVRLCGLLYRLRWLSVQGLPRPVVSVGNLTVGGTGKTPTAIWLARELDQRGHRVAILSRGYKGAAKEPVVLEPAYELARPSSKEDGDFLTAGDEPVMMARLFGRRVGVGKNRLQAGAKLLAAGETDIFILDDGFQHRRLNRDVDLLLLGSDSNGWLLPAGAFREPRKQLGRAHLYLVTGARERWEPLLADRPAGTVFFGALQPRAVLTFESGRWKEYPLTLLDRSKILAVSAIADPGPFYRMIHDWDGEIIETMQFPDHHNYSTRDWQRIIRVSHNADYILTTEKDIVKLARFPFAREKLLALRVEMVVENGAALVDAVESLVRRNG